MPVQNASVPTTEPGPISANRKAAPKHPIHIRTNPYAGRKYHASSRLPANTDLLGDCTPYSYTIWKRFRNEVCAECWRYDRGRRAFLTRRDAEGFAPPSRTEPPNSPSGDGGRNHSAKDARAQAATNAAGAGLWFCDADCQQRWIAREGIDTVGLLRWLEGARQKKPKAPPTTSADAGAQREITQEDADHAWISLHERERSPKEVRKWRNLQLDDYETDMARYVLFALLRYHRERLGMQQGSGDRSSPVVAPNQTDGKGEIEGVQEEFSSDAHAKEGYEQGSGWRTFSSLQTNEVSLLRTCPEILAHQIRIYQLLRGRFSSTVAAGAVSQPPSRSRLVAASSPNGIKPSADDGVREDTPSSTPWRKDVTELADVITVANVRTILGVDPGNSFGIWEVPLMEESECLGFAVYPVASFFNHRECTVS